MWVTRDVTAGGTHSVIMSRRPEEPTERVAVLGEGDDQHLSIRLRDFLYHSMPSCSPDNKMRIVSCSNYWETCSYSHEYIHPLTRHNVQKVPTSQRQHLPFSTPTLPHPGRMQRHLC